MRLFKCVEVGDQHKIATQTKINNKSFVVECRESLMFIVFFTDFMKTEKVTAIATLFDSSHKITHLVKKHGSCKRPT